MTDTKMAGAAGARAQLIESLLQKLHSYYVFPEIAQEIERSIGARLGNGAYDEIADTEALCEALTADMQAISHDKHLRLFYNAEPQPNDERESSLRTRAWLRSIARAQPAAQFRLREGRAAARQCRLPGPARLLTGPSLGGETAVAAMNLLAHTGALIVDLRQNGGGDPADDRADHAATSSTRAGPPQQPVLARRRSHAAVLDAAIRARHGATAPQAGVCADQQPHFLWRRGVRLQSART